MLYLKLYFAFLLLESVYHEVSASKIRHSYKGYQVWRVHPSTEIQLYKLAALRESEELDFWKEPTVPGIPVTFLVTPEQRSDLSNKLREIGIKGYSVDLEDVQHAIEEHKSMNEKRTSRISQSEPLTISTFDYSRYHPPSEVYDWMDMVVREFNETATKRQYGVTYEGRPLYVLEFVKKSSLVKRPKIFIDALIHCREWITTASVLFMFKEMLTNPKYGHLMTDVDWYFVPMVNVDGYDETWKGDRLWRKTKSSGSGPSERCIGIDGNRNWDAFWSTIPGASNDSCSWNYYGPTPESESEVRHLANYVLEFGNGGLDAYVSTHSAAQLILYPYIYKVGIISADDALLNKTGKAMSHAVLGVHNKKYIYGRGSTTIYPASGTTTDWTYEKAGIAQSYTYELRDTGKYGHLLPPDQIIPNGEEYLEGIRALKDAVLENFVG